MTIKEISNIIDQKDYLFQVSIPNTPFKHGRISKASALADSPSLEDYLNRIAKNNSAKNLLIKLYTPNGSSFKTRGEHLIFLDNTVPVATTEETKTNVVTIENKTLQGLDEQQQKPISKTAMDTKELIGYEVLKVRHDMLESSAAELKEKNKELSKKVDLLQEEKLELVKQNSVSKEKNDLELERAKFEASKEAKEGLSGIMGELNENPETLKMLIGLFKPDHPMFKNDGVSGAEQIEAPKFHSDPDVNTLLADLPNTIKDLDPKIISQIYVIFLKGFAAKPETVKIVFELLFPPKKP